MTWPQAVILGWMVLEVVMYPAQVSRSRSATRGDVTVAFLASAVVHAALAGVLHAGGFW